MMQEGKYGAGPRRERGRVAVGHPVDVASGEFFGDHSDFELDGPVPLTLSRRYSTGFLETSPMRPAQEESRESPFGPGWYASWQWELQQTLDGFIVINGEGTEFRFRDSRDTNADFAAVGRLLSAKDGMELVRVDRWRLRLVRFGLQREPISHVFVWSDTERRFYLERIERTADARVDVRYDAQGRVAGLFQTVGERLLRIDWEGDRVRRVVLELPDATQKLVADYVYDRGVLVEVHDRDGLAERFTYDVNLRMVRMDYRSAATHVARYDHKGRCVYVSGSDRYDEKTLRYEDHGRTTWVTDSKGATTRYFYNELGQVLRETSPLGTVRAFEFDESGRPTVVHRPTGGSEKTIYDEWGRTRQVIRADGGTRTFEHDELHRVTAFTDEAGACTRFEYDEEHNIVRLVLANGAEWRYWWTRFAKCAGIRNPLGHERSWLFDRWGNATTESDWCKNVWASTFNALGQIVARADPLGNVTYLFYDQRDDVCKVIDADGRVWEQYTSVGGREKGYLGPDGRRARTAYSTCGLPVENVDEEGRRIRFEWDTEPGRLLRVIDANGLVYAFDYDAEGNVTGRRTFDGRSIIHRWVKGLLRETIDGTGEAVHWTYDAMDRPVERRSRDIVVEYSRDIAGRLIRVDSNGVTTEFKYDALGNCTEELQEGTSLRRVYDMVGNAVSMNLAGNDEIHYDFDPNGACVGMSRGALRMNLTRDGAGREIRRYLSGVGVLEQTYDPSGRVLTQALVSERSDVGYNIRRQVSYTNSGAVQTIFDSLRGHTNFLHDATDMLTGMLHPDGSGEAYIYDAAGNRTRAASSVHGRALLISGRDQFEPNVTHRLDASFETLAIQRNRVMSQVAQDRKIDYDYDNAGRTTARTVRSLEGAATTYFTWDTKGHLVSVKLPNGEVWRYLYDGLGRRIAKIRPDGAKEQFVWDGYRVTYHIDAAGKRTAWSYASDDMCPAFMENDSACHIIADAAGCPAEVIATDGKLQYVVRKDVWGRNFDGGPVMQPAQGRWFDEETGLHYNVFRYYDPVTNRFLSPDPVGLLGGFNEYIGVPSPVMWRDPLGLTSGPQSPACKGSGPVPGVIEVSALVKSIKAFLNYNPKGGGIEYVFDPITNRFAVGRPRRGLFDGSPHEQLAQSIGADPRTVVGGVFRRMPNGVPGFDEWSGHYYQNWTPAVRQQFTDFMQNMTGGPVDF